MPPHQNFSKVEFGWLKRWWGQNDHLVILGYNMYCNEYFIFEKRRLRDIMSGFVDRVLARRRSPLERAKWLFCHFDDTNFMQATFKYVGSLHVSDTARSARHFVTVHVENIDVDMRDELGYTVINLHHPQETVGKYEAPIIEYFVQQMRKKIKVA